MARVVAQANRISNGGKLRDFFLTNTFHPRSCRRNLFFYISPMIDRRFTRYGDLFAFGNARFREHRCRVYRKPITINTRSHTSFVLVRCTANSPARRYLPSLATRRPGRVRKRTVRLFGSRSGVDIQSPNLLTAIWPVMG